MMNNDSGKTHSLTPVVFVKRRDVDSPSTLAIKLQDKFKVLRDVKEASPSMREMRLDERSRCRRWPPEVSASILEMRLQCRLSDVTVGLRGTSNKLEQQGKT